MPNIQPIILAAGKGTRMKSPLPKVLMPVGGKPMLAHVVETLKNLKTAPPLIVVGYNSDAVRTALPDQKYIEQTQQLGTGHAVAVCADQLDARDVVLVLYGDVPLITAPTLQAVLDACADSGLGLLTTHLANPAGYGRIVRGANGAVEAIVEQKDAAAEQLAITEVNTGILAAWGSDLQRWVAALGNANAQGEYYLTDIIAMAVKEGVNVQAVHPSGPWEVAGANDRVQLAELERMYQRSLADNLMRDGVTLLDPNRLDIRGQLTVGSEVQIDANVIFEGQVSLADGVIIEANCLIKDSNIGPNTRIRAFSHLEGATIGQDVVVGPYARLREGTQLADNSKIGNFVETKKSHIGKGSKVNHLSYIGDTQMGAGVNVGAGTITCNYDGVNKATTTIGDDVFVGSNTALVAPVTLADGSTIGAGSTITKDVAEKELALTRAKQAAIPNWKRPTKK